MKCPHCKTELKKVHRIFENAVEFFINGVNEGGLILSERKEYGSDYVKDSCPNCDKEINLFEIFDVDSIDYL